MGAQATCAKKSTMTADSRHEQLISQHIDVALVYKNMLGLAEAQAYLRREHIPRDIAERVLSTGDRRMREGTKRAAPAGPRTMNACRRRNRVQDAIVEAALKTETKLGPVWALALLRDELVPEEVAARVIAQGPRQLRTRRSD
jgi:hypothetical protein